VQSSHGTHSGPQAVYNVLCIVNSVYSKAIDLSIVRTAKLHTQKNRLMVIVAQAVFLSHFYKIATPTPGTTARLKGHSRRAPGRAGGAIINPGLGT
jgi:hypothetical protein